MDGAEKKEEEKAYVFLDFPDFRMLLMKQAAQAKSIYRYVVDSVGNLAARFGPGTYYLLAGRWVVTSKAQRVGNVHN